MTPRRGLGRPMWIALMEDMPVGFANLTDKGRLSRLCVSPAQCCGMATAFLARVEETAGRRGMRCMTTQASLSILPFFKACGFDRKGTDNETARSGAKKRSNEEEPEE